MVKNIFSRKNIRANGFGIDMNPSTLSHALRNSDLITSEF